MSGDFAPSRMARLAGHITAPVILADSNKLSLAPTAGADWPVVVFMEPPAEDVIKRNIVEDTFAMHELKVHWATDDASLKSLPKDAVSIITVKKRVDAAILDKLPNLKLVAVAFTGYDHVDLELCKERGIAVANVPGYSTDGVAELVFGLTFSLLRHIPIAHQHVRAGKWTWPAGNELSGKRLGVIGTGQIGMRIAEIAKAFRCSKILGYDQFKNKKFVEDIGGEYVQSLATLFLHADVLVVACALTKETKGLVSAKLLKLLRPDSILINCARGAIVDQDSLTKMLGEGRFKAGLDVYEVEPLPADHPLRSVPENQLVTVPHLAYKCEESLRRRQDVTLANILAFLSDNPQNIVS